MGSSDICMLISITAYLLMVIGIGINYAKKNENTDDFYLGGRKLGPFVTAMSAEASDMSSWLLMGLPGVAYLTGIADATWTAIGLALGTYFNWLIVAKRLRRYTVIAGNATTIPVFFSNRYRDEKKILSVIAAVVIIIFFVPYTASGFAACGKLFASLFGMNYLVAMIISAGVIVAYTTLGGFMAASTSDFLQSIIMTMAIIIVLGYGCISAGGINEVMSNAASLSGYLSLTAMHNVENGTATPYGFIMAISTMAWGLGYFGMPHILLRFMAIEDEKKLTLSRRIATVWAVFAMFVAVFIGVAGNAMSKAGAIPTLKDPETIIIAVSSALSKHGVLAALIAGVILAGILAATMSTADSQLLAASSSVSQNIIKEVFFKSLSDKASMIIARITVLVISFIGMFIARNQTSSVFAIVSFAWAGFGAAFGPVMLFSLFWKRTNLHGALAGMLSGGTMIFVWKFMIRPLGGIWNIYELLPAFIISSLFIVVVSLLTKEPSEEIIREFESVDSAIIK